LYVGSKLPVGVVVVMITDGEGGRRRRRGRPSRRGYGSILLISSRGNREMS